MKRALFTLLCGLALQPVHAAIEPGVFIELSNSVLKIEAIRVQGGYSLGSGVVVAPDKVVTNCHVTRDARQIAVVRGEARWRVSSQLVDAEHDLCLLHAPGVRGRVIPLAPPGNLKLGQPVIAIGYTGGVSIQSSEGAVVGLHRHDGAEVVRSSNWFSSGASGGALLDQELRLVGVLTFRLRGGEAHYFAAPTAWLQRLIDEPDASRFEPVQPQTGQAPAYWQRPPQAQPRFLQAAVLERNDRWAELDELATRWLKADPSDPEPWYLHGAALSRLNHPADAHRALECALQLEPAYAAAGLRLAELAAQPGAASRPAHAAATAATPHGTKSDNRSRMPTGHCDAP